MRTRRTGGRRGVIGPRIVFVGLMLLPGALRAQEPEAAPTGEEPGRRSWRVDLETFYATGAWTRPLSGAWSWGPEVGVGIHEQVTLSPDDADFTRIVHGGAVLSRRVGERGTLDLSARVGIADILEVCPASDCLPEAYGAIGLGGAWGWRVVRIGTRLTLARLDGRGVTAWSPLFLRFRF